MFVYLISVMLKLPSSGHFGLVNMKGVVYDNDIGGAKWGKVGENPTLSLLSLTNAGRGIGYAF
jgi:hypothetical protein